MTVSDDATRTRARAVVAAMTAYTLELREAAIKLNQNESPFDFPPELKDQVLAEAKARHWNIYPDFEAVALRGALARANGLSPDNVLVGNGSNELLAATISTFIGPGTPVIFPRPTFALYEKLATVAGGVPIPVEFDPATGTLPIADILRIVPAVENAVIIVCSPNNPTGGALGSRDLQSLLDSGAMVLFDRAYGDFAEHNSFYEPFGSASMTLHPRLVTFSTFSKAWGLAGLRVGWLASTAENCREIRKVKLPYSLNIISEAAAVVALERRDVRDLNVQQLVAERQRMIAAMAGVPRVRLFPTQANFITFRVEKKAREIFEELHARGVLIRDVSSYPRLAYCLRVSIGSPAQNDRFLEVLREVV